MSLITERPIEAFYQDRITFPRIRITEPVALLAPVSSLHDGLMVFISRETRTPDDDFLDDDGFEPIVYHVYVGSNIVMTELPVTTWNKERTPEVDDLVLITPHGSISLPHNARFSPHYHGIKMYDVSEEFDHVEIIGRRVELRRK